MSRRKPGKMTKGRSGLVPNESLAGRGGLMAEIAYTAARLIAEEGVNDLGAAKRKAARQLGVPAGALLPDDFAVDTALRAHQALFQRESQPGECHALRKIAAETMRWLHHFSPWLVGTVLSGSANRFSIVELEIVADSGKPLELFFLNEGVSFKIQIRRNKPRHADAPRKDIALYALSFRDCPVEIALYPDHATRGRQLHARAQLAAVELLLGG